MAQSMPVGQPDRDLLLDCPKKVLTPKDFNSLEILADPRQRFERHYELIAKPFEWKESGQPELPPLNWTQSTSPTHVFALWRYSEWLHRKSGRAMTKGLNAILQCCGTYYQSADLFYQRLWYQRLSQIGFRVISVRKQNYHQLWELRMYGSLTAESYLLVFRNKGATERNQQIADAVPAEALSAVQQPLSRHT